jgi:hypothetical protein
MNPLPQFLLYGAEQLEGKDNLKSSSVMRHKQNQIR